MLSFKSFVRVLFEGGNVRYTNEKGELVGSTPIELSERKAYQGHLKNLTSGLSKHFGSPLAFEGSSEHFMNEKIPDEKFKKVGKETFGDVDTNVEAKPTVLKRMRNLSPGMSIGDHDLIHVHQSKDPNDRNGVYTLWKHRETGKIIQLDISPRPSDPEKSKMTSWIKSSPAEDLFPEKENEPSLKGFASKLAASSATRALTSKRVMIRSPKGRSMKEGETYLSLNTGGKGEAGMRSKTNFTGEKHANGLEIHQDAPSSQATDRMYDPAKMTKRILGDRMIKDDVKDFNSMRGVHRILRRHGTPEQHQRYVDGMVDRLYGSSSQPVNRHDVEGGKEKDHKAKDDVIKQLKIDFPEQMKKHEKTLDALKQDYDKKMMQKQNQELEEEIANSINTGGGMRGLGFVTGVPGGNIDDYKASNSTDILNSAKADTKEQILKKKIGNEKKAI